MQKINSSKLRALRFTYYIGLDNGSDKPLSIRDLSYQTDISVGVLFELETNNEYNPTLKTMCAICEFYSISIPDILN